MNKFYILNNDGDIIGEVLHLINKNPMYFRHAIAHAFDVNVKLVVSLEEYNNNTKTHLCVVCHKIPVDVVDGYDTCPDCVALNQ